MLPDVSSNYFDECVVTITDKVANAATILQIREPGVHRVCQFVWDDI